MKILLNHSPRTTVRTVAALTSCVILLPGLALIPGCSVYMEATRPTPVNLTQFEPGRARDAVIEQLGAPTGTTSEANGASCDLYQLYTHGYGAGGKVPIALLEGAADVFTLGLAEVVTTPVEGATQNQRHPVTFCYKDARLARISESGQQIVPGDSTTAPASATPAANDSVATTSATSSSPLRTDADTGGGQPAVASAPTKSN